MAKDVIKDLPLEGWTSLLGLVAVMTVGRGGRYWHLACKSQLHIFHYTGQFLTARNYSVPYPSFECLVRHSCMTYSLSAGMCLFVLSVSTICKLFCAVSLFQWRYFVLTMCRQCWRLQRTCIISFYSNVYTCSCFSMFLQFLPYKLILVHDKCRWLTARLCL